MPLDSNRIATLGRDPINIVAQNAAAKTKEKSMSALKKIGDYAEGLRTLAPGESEIAGIRAVEENVNNTALKSAPRELIPANASVDRINSRAKYGDNPGEQRIDTRTMT